MLILVLIVAPELRLGPSVLQASLKEQLSLWLFVVNWTHTAPYGFTHFWSLAVEEQSYLFWPLIVHRLLGRRPATVCVYIALLVLVMRVIMVFSGASGWPCTLRPPRAWTPFHLAARARVFFGFLVCMDRI